jgi:O-antigen/teichoic acid export membrane protein
LSGLDNAAEPSRGSNNEHADNIGHKARRGLTWSLLGNLGARSITFAIGLVLARLLSPADFGVCAIALAAMTFAMRINDGGIVAACVQWRGKLEDMAPTGSTIALLSSLCVYALIWVFARPFATLSGAPDAAPVVRLLCLIIVFDGVSAVRTAALLRRFEQDRLTHANVIGMLANAAVAIPLGFANAGAYSFAWGMLTGFIVTNLLVFKMGNLPPKLGFDRETAKRLVKFGLPLTASLAIEAILLNADYVIVGNMLGTMALGFYLLAFNISNWVPTMVGTAVRYVSVPSFSRLAEQGREAVQFGVRRSAPLLVSTILPIAVLIATMAPQLIDVVYGEKWGPSAVVLRFLSVLMVVRMLATFALDILISLGLTKANVWVNAGWTIVLLPALWIGTHLDGIRGTAIAHDCVAIAVALPLVALALKKAGVNLLPILPALVRAAFGAAISASVIVGINASIHDNPVVQLMAAGGAGIIVFIIVAVPFDQFRQLVRRAD